MKDTSAGPGQRPLDVRRDRAAVVAAARLCVVPLAVAASLAAGDGILRDPAYIAVAAAALLYASGIWLLVRAQRIVPPRVQEALDIAVVLALVLVADVHGSAAGRVPLMMMFFAWGLILPPRGLVLRGVGLGAVVLAAEFARHGAVDALQVAVFLVVLVAIAVSVAARVSERRMRHLALVRRAEALQADAEALERRERARIAQLLHDDALQQLLAARQDLDGVRDDDEAMRRVESGLADATAALRNLTLVVHDDALEAAGFEAAVDRIAQDAASRAGLELDVRVDSTIEGDAGSVLLPILRELVANVERHANASRLEIEIRQDASSIAVRVADDGEGFSSGALAEAARAGSLGYVGLRRRVDDLAGSLQIDSAPGRGSEVIVRVRTRAIEARRAVEESLRNEREFNAALLSGFPDPFLVLGDDLRILEVSDRFVGLTGWSRAELLGAPPGALPYLPPSERAALRDEIAAREPWVDYALEGVLYCRDGRRVEVIVSVRWVKDPRGGRAVRLITYKDISARLQAERELRAERDLSNAIRTVLREAFLHTHDGVVVAVNRAFCELTGYTEEQLVGARRPYFFIRTATLADAFEHAARMEAGEVSEVELLIRRADGSEFRARVVGVAVRDGDGQALGRVQTAAPIGEVPPLGPILPLPEEES